MPSRATGICNDDIFDARSIASSSSIASTATADDLPGAGYLVGLFYKKAGRLFDIQAGRIAEAMGKGPRVTAERIERRSTELVGTTTVAAENKELRKDCRQLLSYARFVLESVTPSFLLTCLYIVRVSSQLDCML